MILNFLINLSIIIIVDNDPQTSSPINTSNADADLNRKRPKRGRYRNYNKQDLDQAVKAVQRGEMSVHRAGTLFSIPHSTLEYKVSFFGKKLSMMNSI